ncbi:hypothetical protein CC78DRAFT_432795, partial [Lojkania enalia]
LKIDSHPIEIRASLFNAIHTLRSTNTSRLMWIDAIRINQGNWDKKGYQVSIMGQIYKTTENVVVYL